MPTKPEGFEPVPSYKVTAEMLREWGFPVEQRGHVVGSSFIQVEGDHFDVAMEKAGRAGFVYSKSTPDSERWWCNDWKPPTMDPEMGAYFMRILRKEDR